MVLHPLLDTTLTQVCLLPFSVPVRRLPPSTV